MLVIPERPGDKLVMHNQHRPAAPSMATTGNLVKVDYIRVSEFPAPYNYSPTTGFVFVSKGRTNHHAVVETSVNLVDWVPFLGFRAGEEGFLVTDQEAISLPHRFYRVK